MFEQPYCDTAYADEIVFSDASNANGLETQKKSVVMLKNDGTIKGEAPADKPTVYIPYVFSTGFSVSWMNGINEGDPSWKPGMDLDIMGKYFNIVTDTPTDDGVERASAEDIADCDYILVGMTAPYALSYDSHATAVWFNYDDQVAAGEIEAVDEEWYPYSLQYAEYTADTARDPSISGLTLEDGSKENRSFKGQTAPADANYGHLEALQYADSVAGDIPVIVSMKMERPMVWTEVEPLADVILVCYKDQYNDAVAQIITGEVEPTGLLVFQQPSGMETVEAQLEDVPRDMECYTDANGNTYDFAFGLNWAGVIDDERTAAYSEAPLTEVENFDYAAYAEANRG
jgi:beta-glucosidase